MAHWLKIYMASFIFINDTNGFCSQQNQHSACSFYPEMPRVQVTEFSHHHISSITAHSHEWAQSDQRAISSLPCFLKSCSWLWPQGRMDVPSGCLHSSGKPSPDLLVYQETVISPREAQRKFQSFAFLAALLFYFI